jgi:hypothetical protein
MHNLRMRPKELCWNCSPKCSSSNPGRKGSCRPLSCMESLSELSDDLNCRSRCRTACFQQSASYAEASAGGTAEALRRRPFSHPRGCGTPLPSPHPYAAPRNHFTETGSRVSVWTRPTSVPVPTTTRLHRPEMVVSPIVSTTAIRSAPSPLGPPPRTRWSTRGAGRAVRRRLSR